MPAKTITPEQAKRERDVAVATIRKMHAWTENTSKFESANIYMCQERQEHLRLVMHRFRSLQDVLEKDSDEEAESDLRHEIDDIYFETLSLILEKINKLTPVPEPLPEPANVSIPPPVIAPSNTPMPPVKLPEFDGDFSQWISFISRFKAHVHEKNFDASYKLELLKRCLRGEAARQISDLDDTPENYTVAIEMLEHRWYNKKILTFSHLEKIYSAPSIVKPTADAIITLLDTVQSNLRTLEYLEYEIKNWDEILAFWILKKLDSQTRQKWEEYFGQPDVVPTTKKIFEFLEKRAQVLRCTGIVPDYKPQRGKTMTASFNQHSSEFTKSCPLCGASHALYFCTEYISLTIQERREKVKSLRCCFNCLSKNHIARDCKSSSCRVCNGNHHSSLCFKSVMKPVPTSNKGLTMTMPSTSFQPSIPFEPSTSYQPYNQETQTGTTCSAYTSNQTKLLPTAVVMVQAANGEWIQGRTLIDSCSQFHFVTERFQNLLGLKSKRANATIQVLGGEFVKSSYETNLIIKSRTCDYSVEVIALSKNKITDYLPEKTFRVEYLKIPKNIELADPRFFESHKIDMLLGADITFKILSVGQIELGEGLPILQNTLFGWVAAGPIGKLAPARSGVCNVAVNDEPEFNLERFFEIEELGPIDEKLFTAEEQACESYFDSTTIQRSDGYYEVRHPLNQPIEALGDSREIAVRRETGVRNRLRREPPEVQKLFDDFMNEYKDLNHMQEVHPSDLCKVKCYIPYTYVTRMQSSTTKLRVVFDASAATTSGLSLNDITRVGPTLQQDLFSLVSRFRTHKYVFGGDIEKMFRQIMIHPEDTFLQCIIWNEKVYRLLTVTYGTACAPYLAVRTVIKNARDHETKYPHASKIAQRDLYMDDLITGAESIEEASNLRKQLELLFGECNMKLRKWYSNNAQILEGVPDDDCEICLPLEDSTTVKTLGMVYYPKNDVFRVKTSIDTTRKVTKRIMASDIARIFDVLGLLGPVVVKLKILCQQLWKLKLDWDKAPPQNIYTEYNTIREELPLLNDLLIPRWLRHKGEVRQYEIHGFCDASINAYGACVYLRTCFNDGSAKLQLIAAKSRVAPCKRLTIPRLELCGAELLCNMVSKLLKHLSMNIKRIYCWTDSTIVLQWLRMESSHLQVFVGNRVSRIQAQGYIIWRHVTTNTNPADLISRGATPGEFMDNNFKKFWFNGPSFLTSEENWPTNLIDIPQELPEIRKGYSFIITNPENLLDAINPKFHHSALAMLRIFGHILNFIRGITRKRQKTALTDPNSYTKNFTDLNLFNSLNEEQDLCLAGLFIVLKTIQLSSFQNEFQCLVDGRMVEGKLRKLCPFVSSEDGLIHVGGRLGQTNFPELTKHPVLVPSNYFAKALMRFIHFRQQHCGPSAIVAAVRRVVWPLNCRITASLVVRECVLCFMTAPRAIEPKMGDLHKFRTTIRHRPFVDTAIDFAAGILIHQRGRGRRPLKAYVCVFVCMATRAVHLELVEELTTNAFIACLRRFVSRRGLCSTISCDNGTNFRGAHNEFKSYIQFLIKNHSSIQTACNVHHIKFNFSPPNSPHFNGLAEAGVKSMKRCLIRAIGHSSLTYEEMYTILVQIEAALNSRPIMAQSDNPNDLEPLTPGHFLIGEALQTWFEPIHDSKLELNERYRRLRQLYQHFWARWSTEYVVGLQQRYKWHQSRPNVEIGSMVLLRDDSRRPLEWPIGRIVAVYPGRDNVVRVVTVKTRSGTFNRAVTRICPLPLPSKAAGASSEDSAPLIQGAR